MAERLNYLFTKEFAPKATKLKGEKAMTYEYEFIEGLIIIHRNGERFVLDTGCPLHSERRRILRIVFERPLGTCRCGL